MNLAQAIETAIGFETKVRDLYVEAAKSATDDKGRRIFEVMAKEEQGHLDYLQSRLGEWQKTGSLKPKDLKTAVPNKKTIDKAVKGLKRTNKKGKPTYGVEVDMLRKALAAELETSAFYKKMVEELDADSRGLFARFVEIEEGHVAIVQAELDSVTGMGFWFDVPEFNLENG
jgi:rubrerythrin